MKKFKILLLLLLILTLSMSTTTLMSSVAGQFEFPTLSVQPSEIVDPPIFPPDTFNIWIHVADVFDLYMSEFKLKFNPNILQATSVSLLTEDSGGLWPVGSEDKWVEPERRINNDIGYVWYCITMPEQAERGIGGGDVGVSGDLAIVSFQVVDRGPTMLDLDETTLQYSPGNPNYPGQPIDPVMVIDSYFSNVGKVPIVSFTVSTTTPISKEVVTFDASKSYGPIYPIVRYDWNFGDGYTAWGDSVNGTIVTHYYIKKGAYYTATLTITDSSSAQCSLSVQMHVITPVVELFGFKSRPEHYYYNRTADEDDAWEIGGIVKIQEIYGKIQNYDPTRTLKGMVIFDIYFADGTPLRLGQPSSIVDLAPYGTKGSADWGVVTYLLYVAAATKDPDTGERITPWSGIPLGGYYVMSRAYYFDGTRWVPGTRVDTFSFVVVDGV